MVGVTDKAASIPVSLYPPGEGETPFGAQEGRVVDRLEERPPVISEEVAVVDRLFGSLIAKMFEE